MSYVSNPAPPEPKRMWPRFIFPAIVILVCAALTAAPYIWQSFDEFSDDLMPLFMLASMAAPAGVGLLTVWWLFFSPFRWRTRLLLFVLVLVGAPAGWYFAVQKVELTTNRTGMIPRFFFAWETTDTQRFEDYQARQPAGDSDLPPIDATIGPTDCPSFRGPKRDGIVTFLKLETDWAKHPPKVLWRRPCVGGYSGIAIAGNIAVTQEQRFSDEAIVCYDRATGRQRWAHTYPAYHKDVMGDGPRATPTIHAGLIFTFGATGELVCLNVKGEPQWSKKLLRDATKKITWGMSGSPLIVDDLVVVNAGQDSTEVGGASLVAYEQTTGKLRWSSQNRKAGYSSPQLCVLAGVPQILLFDAHGLVSHDPKTGNLLWMTPWETKMDMNTMQPMVLGDDRVFISSEATNGCAMLCAIAPTAAGSNWTVEKAWENKALGTRFASPVSDGKRIFAMHNVAGEMKCLDAATGKLLWRGERYGAGQLLLVGDVLLAVDGESGQVSLLKTNADAEDVMARFPTFDGKTWNMPAIAGDQLFLRNQTEIACIQLPKR